MTVSMYDLIKYSKCVGAKIDLKPVSRVLVKGKMQKENPNKCIEEFINSNKLLKNIIHITDSVCDDSVRYTENFMWMSDSDSTKHEYENGIFYNE